MGTPELFGRHMRDYGPLPWGQPAGHFLKMKGQGAWRGRLSNAHDQRHTSAESYQIDEQPEQLDFGQHIQILAEPRIPQMIFSNGANALRAMIQPARRQTSALFPEQLRQKRGVFAADKIPICLGKNRVAQELQVSVESGIGRLAVQRAGPGFFRNRRAILRPQEIKQGPDKDGRENEKENHQIHRPAAPGKPSRTGSNSSFARDINATWSSLGAKVRAISSSLSGAHSATAQMHRAKL